MKNNFLNFANKVLKANQEWLSTENIVSDEIFTGNIIEYFKSITNHLSDGVKIKTYRALYVDAADMQTILHAAYWYKLLGHKTDLHPEVYCQTSEDPIQIDSFLKKLGIRRSYINILPNEYFKPQDVLYIQPCYKKRISEISDTYFVREDIKKTISDCSNIPGKIINGLNELAKQQGIQPYKKTLVMEIRNLFCWVGHYFFINQKIKAILKANQDILDPGMRTDPNV